MMALLGSLLGFGSSFLPEVLSYFKANQVQKHRMEMMQLETQLAQKRSEMKLVELDKQADIAETKGLYEHDRSIDAGGFINALRGSVRPVITYAFFRIVRSHQGSHHGQGGTIWGRLDGSGRAYVGPRNGWTHERSLSVLVWKSGHIQVRI